MEIHSKIKIKPNPTTWKYPILDIDYEDIMDKYNEYFSKTGKEPDGVVLDIDETLGNGRIYSLPIRLHLIASENKLAMI